MENKDKWKRIITDTIKNVFIIIILYLISIAICFSCSVDIYETTSYENDSIIKNIVSIVLVILICKFVALIKIKKKDNEFDSKTMKWLYLIIIIIWIISSYIWIFSTQLIPRADQYYVLQTANEILEGNFSAFDKGGYMQIYPGQSGIVLFFTLCGMFFGKFNYMSIQILNILAILISYYFIYRICILLFNYDKKENNEAIAILLGLLLFTPMFFYTTFVYGNMFGLMLSIMAIYFELSYLKNEKIYKLIISFVCITLAVLIKMNYIITMIGMVIYLIYSAISKKKKIYFIYIIGMILILTLGNKLVDISINKITGKNLGDGVPKLAWIEMGLQEGGYAPGWYNGYNLQVFRDNDYNTEKAQQQVEEDLKKTLSNYSKNLGELITYINAKIISQWANPTFQCFWINQNRITNIDMPQWSKGIIQQNGIYDFLVEYMDILQTLILFGTLMYFCNDFNKIDFEQLIFAIIFIGGFIFHIIWEAKCQYTITYFILIIPYAIRGYSSIIKNYELNFKLQRKEETK